MHRDVGPLNACKFGLELLFGRIDNHSCLLTEEQAFSFHKTKHGSVTHSPGINLVDSAFVDKHDLVDMFLLRCFHSADCIHPGQSDQFESTDIPSTLEC